MNTMVVYCMKHKSAWGSSNDHYKACWKLRQVIADMSQEVQSKLMVPRLLLILQWLIMKDHHQYYQDKKTKDEVTNGQFPSSGL